MNGNSRTVTTRIDRDAPLVAALRRGDPTAVEDLVATYGDRAWRLATRITGPRRMPRKPCKTLSFP